MAPEQNSTSWKQHLGERVSPQAGVSWFRQNFTWSNSWPSWCDRIVLLVYFAIAVGLVELTWAVVQNSSDGSSFGGIALIAAAWGAYLLAVVLGSWLGWLKLFGPVLFYDMVRTARQNRYLFVRLLYACVLLAILCVIFFMATERGIRDRPFTRDAAAREAALLAESFFGVFMIVQLILVGLLTPAYVAGAIADEKDRKTLEFMLATDLNNREIVLSKLLSRVANMTMLLITGLPILSILQFVGGVDSQLMLAGFACTGLTMLGIASVGILLSTQFSKARDAIALTYIFVITYLAAATFAKGLDAGGAPFMKTSIWFGETGPTYGDISYVLNAGNPISAIIDVMRAIDRASLNTDLPPLVRDYTAFHVSLALVCVLWSIFRLRSVALRQTVAGTAKRVSWWTRYRPPIGDLPMMWKELHIESRMKLNWLARGVVAVLVLLTVGTGIFLVGAYVWTVMFDFAPRWMEMSEAVNVWFRICGTGVLCLMILIVAVRASTSVASERERDTFDALVTTPMSAEAMLSAKLLGCLTSLRAGWIWFGSMAAIALLTGAVHPLAMPIVLGAFFAYATFFTMIGMWFSMACKSSMRATVYTVLTTLFLGGGHWLVLGFLCYLPMAILSPRGPNDFFEVVFKFQASVTPPIVIALYSFSWHELANEFRHQNDVKHILIFAVFGLTLWIAGCLVMWFGLLLPKFRQITRREEQIYE